MIRKVSLSIAAPLVSLLLLIGLASVVHAAPAAAPAPPPQMEPAGVSGTCNDGVQASGAAYRICMPTEAPWNGDLVVYAHGYVAFYRPVAIPEDQMALPGYPLTVDQMVNGLGYAFAASSYYTNGLAVLPALSDLTDLVDIFVQTHTTPTHVLLTGVSEGGLITTLGVEQYPDVFDGGLAMCGPYGDFVRQAQYIGDARVVFDYFFPGLMPGSPVSISAQLQADWETGFYTDTILLVLEEPANAVSITQMLQVLGTPPYTFNPPESTTAIERLLWYNVYATNDAIAKLGGQPFDNLDTVYQGSNDDAALNAAVARFPADPAAITELELHYQTSGVLTVPLVMMHTTGDALVPFWHMPRYYAKTLAADNIALYHSIRVERFGHCSFNSSEVYGAFAKLAEMVEKPPPYRPVSRVLMPLVIRVP